MARKQCRVCGQPATVRVETNLNGRHSTMQLCDDHYRQLVRQQKRTVSPLEALFGSRSGLFEDFLGLHWLCVRCSRECRFFRGCTPLGLLHRVRCMLADLALSAAPILLCEWFSWLR